MTRSQRLWLVLGLNLALVGLLVAVGQAAHSIAVFAEGADYLADAAAIGVSLFAIWLTERPPNPARPNGYPRATSYAALVNGGWLLVLCCVVIAGSVRRLITGAPEVHGLPVLVVSGIAAAVMLIGAFVLGGDIDDPEDHGGTLNMRAVLLDTAADAAVAAGVAVTGALILATHGLYWLDPSVAIIVSAIVAFHAVKLLHRVVIVLRTSDSPD